MNELKQINQRLSMDKNFDREARRKALAEQARINLVESGELTIKLDPKTYLGLLTLADSLKVPVGVLVRSWIEEKVKTDV